MTHKTDRRNPKGITNDLITEVERLKAIAEDFERAPDKTVKRFFERDLLDQIITVYDIAMWEDGTPPTTMEQKVKIPKSLIKTMHNDSISCMKKNPNDKYHKSACECVHWNSHFDQNSMTLHTHTIPDVDYPSEADIKTTNNLNKNNLCIINVSDKTVTCYNKADNFKKITQQDTY